MKSPTSPGEVPVGVAELLPPDPIPGDRRLTMHQPLDASRQSQGEDRVAGVLPGLIQMSSWGLIDRINRINRIRIP